MADPQRIRTTCNRDCPDACGMIATVQDGRVLRVQGDPEHPVTRGFLCERTNRDYPARLSDPDRLTTPLLRQGDGFVPIGWDAALDLVAEQLLRFREESGPASILRYRCGGALGILKGVIDAFFDRFGPVSAKGGDICSGAGDAAQELDFGVSEANDLFQLRAASSVLVWGRNVYTSAVHQLPLLKEARARGARMVLVDPVRHRTAELCDAVLQPRPGTDFELAMALSRRLLDEGRWHPDAASWCAGFEDHRALVRSRGVDEWLAPTGLAAADLDSLAAAFAAGPDAGPVTILVGWGLQRRANGGGSVRALDALAAVTGQLGVPGAGVFFSTKRRGAFDTSFGVAAEPPRRISEALLAEELDTASDPPLRMVWIDGANPVVMLPGSQRLAAALRRREFVVVVDSFLTDTAQQADLVLPCATMLEEEDLVGAYGHHWIGEQRAVVPPPPGVRSDLEIVAGLARRVGLGAEFDRPVEDWKRMALARVAPLGAGLEALQRGPVRNPEAPEVRHAGRRFATPDGRARLIAAAPPEVPAPTAEWPLYLTAISTPRSQGSQAEFQRRPGPPEARVHPSAAAGLADGARARVVSPQGELEVVLGHDERLHPTVLHMDKGGWLAAGRCANVLVAPRPTDLGGGACYYDQLVRIEAI